MSKERDVQILEHKIAELEKQISDIKVQRDKVDMALNEACRTLNVSSLKTKAGTISRILKTKYWTSDWTSMYDFILENKLQILLYLYVC
jgi:hypothetical protein